MREIKFRGQRTENCEWVTGFYAKSVNDRAYIIVYATEDAVNTRNEIDFLYIEVIPETVGQYTGLKDKNGKEIYEGDVTWCREGEHRRNTGIRNIGDWNTGSRNTGNRNTGDWNSTNRSTGYFCTEVQTVKIFDIDSGKTYEELIGLLPGILWDIPFGCYWTNDKLKKYTAKDRQDFYDKLTARQKQAIKHIPHFDAEKFEKCTGIRVDED